MPHSKALSSTRDNPSWEAFPNDGNECGRNAKQWYLDTWPSRLTRVIQKEYGNVVSLIVGSNVQKLKALNRFSHLFNKTTNRYPSPSRFYPVMGFFKHNIFKGNFLINSTSFKNFVQKPVHNLFGFRFSSSQFFTQSHTGFPESEGSL